VIAVRPIPVSKAGIILSIGAACFVASPVAAENDGIETAGNVLKIALPLAGGGLALYHHDLDGVLQIGLSWAGAYAASYLIKQVVKEERPDHSGWDSFPSDSTSTAFAAASSIQVRYGWNYGLPAYAVAAFVGYSRVEADKHHWGDVAAGAVLGWGIGQLLTDPYRPVPEVRAFADGNGAGVGAHWTW
jgi:membrane-associated phospholipid phosphatase